MYNMEFFYDKDLDNFVCPVADAPGYFYEWVAPIGDWVVKYKPLVGCYSPPIFDTNLSWYQIPVPEGLAIGCFKGEGALHFENPLVELPFKYAAEDWYQHWSGAAYVFYRPDINKIEIWSSDLHKSIVRIVGWMEEVKKTFKKESGRNLKNFWKVKA